MSASLLSALGVVCPTCDRLNAPGSSQCAECRNALDAGPRAPAAPSQAPSPPGLRPSTRRAVPPQARETSAPPAEPKSAPADPKSVPTAPHPQAPPPVPAPRSPDLRAVQPAPSKFGLSIIAGTNVGQRFRLAGAGCMVGRAKGAILFPDDPAVSPHHATFLLREGRLVVRDEASVSGVYVTVLGGEAITSGAYFAVGQRLFRFVGPLPPAPPATPGKPRVYGAPMTSPQGLYAVEEILVGGRAGRAIASPGPLITVGQQHCDLAYPGDPGIAARHCELSPNGPGATLRDLSGGLGTFVRVPPGTERTLAPGDKVRIGGAVLQIELSA